MDRRNFLKTSTLAAAALGAGRFDIADAAFEAGPMHGWRVFEVTTRVEPAADGAARVWVPLPSVEEAEWIRPMGNLWQGNAISVQEWRDPVYCARVLAAQWETSEPKPLLEVVSRFATPRPRRRPRPARQGHATRPRNTQP